MNTVCIGGRVVKDPEFKQGAGGFSFASLSIAVWAGTDKAGKDITHYFRVVAYKDKAERLSKTYKKGNTIYIEGYLSQRKYTDRNNVNREVIEIVARNFGTTDKIYVPGQDSVRSEVPQEPTDDDAEVSTFPLADDALPF